jgi:hypothetical protein
MIKVLIGVLVSTCLLTVAVMAGCGGGGPDPAVHRAAELCVAEAQKLPAQNRSAIEAACGKMETYCGTEARRDDKLCEAWLQRFK